MDGLSTQTIIAVAVAVAGAAVLLILGLAARALVGRRRAAEAAQADSVADHERAVTDFRRNVEESRARRAELVELLAVAEAGRTDRMLAARPDQDQDTDPDSPIGRLYLDLALAGPDTPQYAAVIRTVRRGISDLDMLLPEAPQPSRPVPGLGRKARAAAERWYAEQMADVPALRELAAAEAQTTLPRQTTVTERVYAGEPVHAAS